MPVDPLLVQERKGTASDVPSAIGKRGDETATSPSPLCPATGTRGLFILQGVREGVLEERKLEEVGLWTQILLARDELNGWSGLRP